MNLIQQAERLKTIPDQELLAMQQRPTVIAPYLVVAEMQRRETMRKATTAGQDPVRQTTVAQEMSSRLAGMQPPQPMSQPTPQQPPAQQMRTGGVVRAQQGLAVPPLNPLMVPPSLPLMVPPSLATPLPEPSTDFARQMVAGQSFPGSSRVPLDSFGMALGMNDLAEYGPETNPAEQLAKLRQSRGANPLSQIADQLGIQEEQMRGRKQGLGEILMRLGLGMAASRRPDFLGAVGEGGLGALQGYMQQRQLNQQQADELQRRRLAMLERVQGSEDVLTREAGELARAENYGRSAKIQTIEANRRAVANQVAQQQIADANRKAQVDLQNARTEQERQKVIEDRKHEIAKINLQYANAVELKNMDNRGRGGGEGGGGGAESNYKGLTPLVGLSNAYGAEAERLRAALQVAEPANRAALQAQYRKAVEMQQRILNAISVQLPNLPRIDFEDDQPIPPTPPKPTPGATPTASTPKGTPSGMERLSNAWANMTPTEARNLRSGISALIPPAAALDYAKLMFPIPKEVRNAFSNLSQMGQERVGNALFEVRQMMQEPE